MAATQLTRNVDTRADVMLDNLPHVDEDIGILITPTELNSVLFKHQSILLSSLQPGVIS